MFAADDAADGGLADLAALSNFWLGNTSSDCNICSILRGSNVHGIGKFALTFANDYTKPYFCQCVSA